MPKRVAIICNYEIFPGRVGGMDHFYKGIDIALKEEGVQVDWFFSRIIYFDFYKELDMNDALGRSVENFFLDTVQKTKANYQVVITHFTALCTSFYKKAKQLTGANIIAVDHNPRPLRGFPLKKKIENRIKGILYHQYIDRFIAVSAYSKYNLEKDFGKQIVNKITIVHNGILTPAYKKKKKIQTPANKFIIACHLRKEKGVQDIINAIAILDKDCIERSTFDIYGEGPYEYSLRELVVQFKLENYINFKGSVSNLYDIYHKYDYLIHASHGETFCFTVVESLLSNLPVITTKEAGNVLNIVKEGENGYLFSIGDIATLSKVIENMLEGTKNIEATNLYEKIETLFSLDAMIENHKKQIARCI